MGWPGNGVLNIQTRRKNGDLSSIPSVSLVGADTPLSFEQTVEALLVQLPKKEPAKLAFVLKIPMA